MKPKTASFVFAVVVSVVVSFWVGVIVARIFPGGLMPGFLGKLHRWQELLGAILGALALTSTVWVTLRSERRKRNEEASALKVALGSELRQFSIRALNAIRDVLKLLSERLSTENPWAKLHKAVALEDIVRFPDPAIYLNSAASVGVLGEYAYFIVHFYNQLSTVRDTIDRLVSSDDLHDNDILRVAGLLVVATESAVRALPAFVGTPRSERDTEFAEAVVKQRAKYDALRSRAKSSLADG